MVSISFFVFEILFIIAQPTPLFTKFGAGHPKFKLNPINPFSGENFDKNFFKNCSLSPMTCIIVGVSSYSFILSHDDLLFFANDSNLINSVKAKSAPYLQHIALKHESV